MGTYEQQLYQRLIAELESSKSLLIANKALQTIADQNNGTIKALQAQASASQLYFHHSNEHMNILMSILGRDGNTMDIITQNWSLRQENIDLQGRLGQQQGQNKLMNIKIADLMRRERERRQP